MVPKTGPHSGTQKVRFCGYLLHLSKVTSQKWTPVSELFEGQFYRKYEKMREWRMPTSWCRKKVTLRKFGCLSEGPEAPWQPPNFLDCSNKKQQFEQEIRTAVQFWVHFWILVLESVISESKFGKWFICWWNLWEKTVIAEVVACCCIFKSFLDLLFLFQRLMIWHAQG